MKLINSKREIKIPKDVRVTVKNRVVTVKGVRGILTRDLSHIQIEMEIKIAANGDQTLHAQFWFGQRKSLATIRTVTAHIQNMIIGVTKGFIYKMRLVYAHFPISVAIEKNGTFVEIRNFLGEKIVRTVQLCPGVTIIKGVDGPKDELILTGNSIEGVSQSAANICQVAKVRNKDIRKFLDGIYVSYSGVIEAAN